MFFWNLQPATEQGLGKRLFLEDGAPVPAQNSRSRAGVETWERLSQGPQGPSVPGDFREIARGLGLLTEKIKKSSFDRKNLEILGFSLYKITFYPQTKTRNTTR